MSSWLGEMITCSGFSVLSDLMDFSVDSDGEASLPKKKKITFGVGACPCGQQSPGLCERRLNSLLVWQQRMLGSHLRPKSRPDPSSPAERGEPGSERRSGSCSGTATHWLVKIARLLASVPGLASGFPDRLQHARPPSRQGLLEDTWCLTAAAPSSPLLLPAPCGRDSPAVTALPASAWGFGKRLCAGGFLQSTV